MATLVYNYVRNLSTIAYVGLDVRSGARSEAPPEPDQDAGAVRGLGAPSVMSQSPPAGQPAAGGPASRYLIRLSSRPLHSSRDDVHSGTPDLIRPVGVPIHRVAA